MPHPIVAKRKKQDIAAVLAAQIRARRTSAGLSQEALADLCGYHRTYVSAIERGERNITLNTLAALGSALGVDPWRLLTDV